MPQTAAGKPIEIWFSDEARVGQKGTLTYIWAPVGSRPSVVRDNRHDSAYLFGAICPARAIGAAVIMPSVNTEAMNEHLKEISSQVCKNAHAVLLLDQAGWHQTGGRLEVPEHITLVPLPAYSPELNPMENVWEYLRQQALPAGLGQLRRHPERLQGGVELSYRRPGARPKHRHPSVGACQSLGRLVLYRRAAW